MGIGRLAWRTPTGAMLWGIWGRDKWKFLGQGALLAASVQAVRWRTHGAPEIEMPGLGAFGLGSFLVAYLHLLTCFGYIEIDARKVQPGFPGGLFLKPVSTIRLALTPMLFGGLAVATVFAIWTELVVQRVLPVSASSMVWAGSVMLSFFWWVQALAWSLSSLRGKVVVDLAMAVIHLLVGLIPLLPPSPLTRWQWPLLFALLLSAMPVAWTELRQARQGKWEGSWRIALLSNERQAGRARGRRNKFPSAFAAQFWLEWRRQGWLLPGITAGIALIAIPGISFALKKLDDEPPQLEGVLALLVAAPLVISSLMATALAKFDRLQTLGELPIYIAIRPMSDGGFIMAKLVMALGTSVLTWLVTLAGVCLCMAVLGTGSPISEVKPSGMPPAPGALVIGCLPMLLSLVVLTGKNLVAGIWVGLSGQTWIIMLFSVWRFSLFIGMIALAISSTIIENFTSTLLHWLPGLLIAGLTAKIAASAAFFLWSLRRNVISSRWIGWIFGGWLLCGVIVAGYAGLICELIGKTDLWIWIGMAGSLVIPLADLAIAPLALAWNRHR